MGSSQEKRPIIRGMYASFIYNTPNTHPAELAQRFRERFRVASIDPPDVARVRDQILEVKAPEACDNGQMGESQQWVFNAIQEMRKKGGARFNQVKVKELMGRGSGI
ncbi:MAG: hypothetical protein LQ346_004913 [Caloplaca aetnensis]|nr:MAG: hypothetical protein LQ346_004913 [Caloplaca aetnensis]